MAQYDLVLTQNVHATGTEFTEKYVNISKGGLLSATTAKVPTVLAGGTDGYMLVRDDAQATGLNWVALGASHTQNTDTGTDSAVFHLDNDGYILELTAESASKFGLKVDGGATYADLQAKDATFAKVTVSAAPSAGTDLTNKTYVDALLATNSSMLYKGTIGVGGTHTIAAFNALSTYNAGWVYKVITAGTIWGNSCVIGDLVLVIVSRTGTNNANADFMVIPAHDETVVSGPSSVMSGYAVLFDGVTGKLIKAGTGPLGTAAYTASTAYATAAQGTLADNAVPKGTFTERGSVVFSSAASTPAELLHGVAGQVLQSGGHSADPTWLTLGTMAAEATTSYVAKSLYDANSILYATSDDTPVALTIGASTIVGRKASGNIVALTPAEAMNVLWVSAPGTKTSAGTAGQFAKDANFLYACTATNVWARTPLATNWP
jgi:hypothetical protein